MSLKAQKELELKLHDQLYNNVHLLSVIYPTTKYFKNAFKKDMFLKNNKTAFQQVIYYLLDILDSETLKKKVPSWPPYEPRLETQFRNEILKYVNELNSLYEYANIPNMTTSHLISPGGFKFIYFIFKISQLVVLEHLKEDTDIVIDMLLPIKPNRNESITKERIKNLDIISNSINKITFDKVIDFNRQFETILNTAENIQHKQHETNKKVLELRKTVTVLRESNNSTVQNLDTEEQFQYKLHEAEKKFKYICDVQDKMKTCLSFVECLVKNDMVLEYKRDLIVPPEISHIITNTDTLDLLQLLEGFNVFVDCKRLELNFWSDLRLSATLQKFKDCNEKLETVNKKLDEIYTNLFNTSQVLIKENCNKKKLNIIPQTLKPLKFHSESEGDSDLAEPLQDTLEK